MEKADIDLAYFAGIIDGEGTIDISGGSIRLRVINTDEKLIKWILDKFEGKLLEYEKSENRRKKYEWRVSGKEAYKIFKLLENILIIKKEQAKICIFLYEKVTRWNFLGRKTMPRWAKNYRTECAQKIHVLNQGTNDISK